MQSNFVIEIFDNPFFAQELIFKAEDGTEKLLVCIVQPASNDDLQFLPEGNRYNPTIRVMTKEDVELKTVLFWGDHRWRVTHKLMWGDYGYHDMLAVRYEGTQSNDSVGFTVT